VIGGDRMQSSATEGGALMLIAATPFELLLAFSVMLCSVLIFAAATPFAHVPWPKSTAFIPSYESALMINDLVTAVVLFGRATRSRSKPYLALACGYLFNAAIIVPHALSFPGVFSETGLLGANDQTTAWLFLFWHGGFPLFVLCYALLPEKESPADFLHGRAGWMILFSVIGVVAIVTALTILATAGHNLLPKVIQNGDYALMISTGASPTVLGLSILALLALWRRRQRAVLDVWLMVVMTVWVLDVTLSAVVSSSRYDLGWYGGRSFGLLASCYLLIVLLFEMNRLYGRLANALDAARALQNQLTFRAENDSLTGLPNRALFYDRLEMAMTRCRRTKKLMALFYIDIDHFKTINDTAGHDAGDNLLRLFAKRLQQCVRGSDTVARLGGDEFTVILENLSSPETAQGVVDKLMTALRHSYGATGGSIQASACIGIAYFSGEELQPDGLIKQADTALYQAKHHGRDRYWVYQSETALVLQLPSQNPPDLFNQPSTRRNVTS